jgi:hypothetical protein
MDVESAAEAAPPKFELQNLLSPVRRNESFELELSGIGTGSDSSRAHSPSA